MGPFESWVIDCVSISSWAGKFGGFGRGGLWENAVTADKTVAANKKNKLDTICSRQA